MPACLAWQASVHPAPGQELVYPGGARLNTRGGRSSATPEWARSQICGIASGVPASSLRGQLYTFQALPPEGRSGIISRGTALLPAYTCKDPSQVSCQTSG